MKNFLKSIFLFLLFFNTVHAEILLDNTTKETVLLNKSEIYLDKTNKETVENLMAQSSLFKPYHNEFINYGLDNKQTLWIKFTLHNTTSQLMQRTISFDEMYVENIFLYSIEENRVKSVQKAGSLHRKKFNGILRHHFNIELQPNSKQTFYLSVYTPSYGLVFKSIITTPEEFIHQDIQYHMIWSLFITVLVTILIYNLFLFFFTKDSLYFYYALYILGILATGKVHYLIWIHIFPMHEPAFLLKEISMIVYYTNFTSLTMVLFTQKFLQTKLYPKLHTFLNFLIVLILVHSLITTPTFLTYQDVALFYLALQFLFFFIGFYALYKKNKNALYFVFGWGLSALAWMSALFHGLNIWSCKYEFYYITEAFITAEVFLFSFAISRYINELNKEKENLTQKLIKRKEFENFKLEKAVKEKTKSLNQELKTNTFLLQELNHRVKNNMQFITSLYALKLENSDEKNIQERLKDVERKVHAMSHFHEMLYTQKDLKCIDADNYFEKVVQTIKESFQLENIRFKFKINVSLELEEAIYCGLIVNELVTNAIKYAFENNEGEILITLTQDESFKYLTIKDNGVGIKEKRTNGFGQTLIEILAVEQLNGEVEYTNNDGTEVKISFRKKSTP